MLRLLVIFLSALLCVPVCANTVTVTNNAVGTSAGGCGSQCTLSDAIAAANGNTGTDRIAFNLSGAGPFDFAFDASFASSVEIDGYSQLGSQANTQEQGTNAVFRIRVLGGWTLETGAIGSTVQGIEFVGTRTGTSPALINRAASLSVLGCLFRGLGDGVNSRVHVVVGSVARADRNRFVSSRFGLVLQADNLAGTNASNSIVINNVFGRTTDLSSAVAIDRAIIVNPGLVNITIGGINANEGNVFSGAANSAVLLQIPAPGELQIHSAGVTIRGNRFADNDSSEVAINLVGAGDFSGGFTANDTDDSDIGPNGLQNFPVLSTAALVGGGLQISGSVDRPASPGSRTYHIDFYASATCQISGHGEGDAFFATRAFISAAPSAESFTFTIPTFLVPQNAVVTATATEDSTGNTSEFSDCVLVTGTPPSLLIFSNNFE